MSARPDTGFAPFVRALPLAFDEPAVKPDRRDPCLPKNGVGLGARGRDVVNRDAETVVDPHSHRNSGRALVQ